MLSTGHDELKKNLFSKLQPFILICLYLLILYFFQNWALYYIAAALFLIEFFPDKKWLILFVTNIAALTIGKLAVLVKIHFMDGYSDSFQRFTHENNFSSAQEKLFIFLALIAFAIFLHLIFKIIKHFKKEPSHTLVIAVVFVLWYFLGKKQIMGPIGLIFSILLMNGVFFLSYEFSNSEKTGIKTFMNRFTFALPFWQLATFPIMPVLMGSQYAERIELQEETLKKNAKIRAIKQALVLLIFQTAITQIFLQLTKANWIIDLNHTKLRVLIGPEVDRVTLWFSFVAQFIYFLFIEIICSAGIIITMLWMLGYEVPKSVDSPGKSLSISELMKRLYFYYNQMILTFFIMPTYSTLSFIKNRKIKWTLSVFWGVFAGGTIYSILRTLIRSEASQGREMPNLFGRSIYFALLGLALAISSLKIFITNEKDRWYKRHFATTIVFLLYFIMFISETKQFITEWNPKLILFRKLLGL